MHEQGVYPTIRRMTPAGGSQHPGIPASWSAFVNEITALRSGRLLRRPRKRGETA